MFSLLVVMFAALMAPAMLLALGVWLVFAVLGLLFRAVGWTFRIAFKALGWLFLATIVFGLIGMPLIGLIVAVVAVVWAGLGASRQA